MNHTIIPFSKKKMLKLTGLYILIMLGIAAIIVFILSADRIKIFYLVLFVVLFIAGTYLFISTYKNYGARRRTKV